MTMKTLLLGAAAGLMTVGAAQAADLPMTKAEAVEYVKVCTEFGEGFFYIPGTDTCLRVSGEIRADYKFFDTSFDPNKRSRNTDAYDFTTEGRIKFDARTQTEYGLLRSFFQINPRAGNHDSSQVFAIDKAFIQLGGLTAGYAHTFFGIYDNDYGDTVFAPYFSSQSTVNLIAYTATFGGGFSATLSIEDGGEHSSFLVNDSDNTIVGYAGKRVPDVIGQLRVDQGWGEAAVFAASHQIRYPDIDTGVPNGFQNAGDDWGFAVGAGVGVKLPFLAGAHIALEGTYADGAANYLGLGGSASDAAFVLLPSGSDTSTGWSITGEFGVDVSPALTLVAFGSYVDYDAATADIGSFGTPDDDFTSFVVGANATYPVVKGLTVAAEVYYQKTEYDVYSDEDTDGFFGGVRIKRTF